MKNLALYFITSSVISFIVTAVLCFVFIPVLRAANLGQKILDIGPSWHKHKEGTPTMGGLFFMGGAIAAAGVVYVLTLVSPGVLDTSDLVPLAVSLLAAMGFALTGFIDGRVKLLKKQNEGLTPTQKLILQFIVTAAYLAAMKFTDNLSTLVVIPFFPHPVEFGIFFYAIALLGIVFTVNAVQFTDGIDGLESCVTIVVAVFFMLLARMTGRDGLSLYCLITVASLAAFLIFNFHPAKVFMGDTGSHFLGGTVIAFAFWAGAPLVILFAGIIYFIEIVSVIIQVTSFKLTGKRVFKMSPIHHHFELCNWRETKIVGVFSFITALSCAVGFLSLLFTDYFKAV